MIGRLAPLLLFAAFGVGLGGCAHEAPEVNFPHVDASGWVVPATYAWPPAEASAGSASARRGAQIARLPPASGTPLRNSPGGLNSPGASSIFATTLGNAPRPRTRDELRSVVPGGASCLARLGEQGVHFHALDHELGVKTPVGVDGPIAGIRYYTGGSGPLIADCRLVLALSLVSPELTSYGVSEVRFSGAYVFRLSNKHRVSLHAYGLAIDLHGFTRFGVRYEVQHDFRKGLGADLAEDAPVANAIAGRFRHSGLFHEYLTPDDNADHHDHIHVGVSPLPDEVL